MSIVREHNVGRQDRKIAAVRAPVIAHAQRARNVDARMGQKIDDPFHIEVGETSRRGGVPQRRHRRKLLTTPGFGPFDHRAHRVLELAE